MASSNLVPDKLARLSRIMSVLSLLGMIVIPALVIAIFLHPATTQFLMFRLDHLGADLNETIPLQFRVGALGCELVPLGCTVWAMWSLRQLFANYAEGRVFSQEPLRYLNNVANALFLGVLTDFLMGAPISYLLTLHNPVGHREVSLSFGTSDAAWLFIAGTVLVIARVMGEARRVADENAAFV
ncbi:MAG TPA: DUF2975 domain-containing protein [Rhizomicrobium sp.]|nr:DUF2975 domain-containing protein [Rhizomicrobium sp.]